MDFTDEEEVVCCGFNCDIWNINLIQDCRQGALHQYVNEKKKTFTANKNIQGV